MASSALEEKINKIRQQNEEIRRRYEEVEADKKNAAKSNALVQLVPSDDWPERREPPEFSAPPKTIQKQKSVTKDRENERPTQHYTGIQERLAKKEHKFAQGEGPPPDPKYNFLADSERETRTGENRTDEDKNKVRNRAPRGGAGPRRRGGGNNIGGGGSRDAFFKDNRGPQAFHSREDALPEYEAWRAERNRIDEARINRQKTAEGNWRREWDCNKVSLEKDQPRRDFARKDSNSFDRRNNHYDNDFSNRGHGGSRTYHQSQKNYSQDYRHPHHEQPHEFKRQQSDCKTPLSPVDNRTVAAFDQSIKVTVNQGSQANKPTVMSVKVNSPSIAGTGRVGPRQKSRITYSSQSDSNATAADSNLFMRQKSFDEKTAAANFNNGPKLAPKSPFAQRKKEGNPKSPHFSKKEFKIDEFAPHSKSQSKASHSQRNESRDQRQSNNFVAKPQRIQKRKVESNKTSNVSVFEDSVPVENDINRPIDNEFHIQNNYSVERETNDIDNNKFSDLSNNFDHSVVGDKEARDGTEENASFDYELNVCDSNIVNEENVDCENDQFEDAVRESNKNIAIDNSLKTDQEPDSKQSNEPFDVYSYLVDENSQDKIDDSFATPVNEAVKDDEAVVENFSKMTSAVPFPSVSSVNEAIEDHQEVVKTPSEITSIDDSKLSVSDAVEIKVETNEDKEIAQALDETILAANSNPTLTGAIEDSTMAVKLEANKETQLLGNETIEIIQTVNESKNEKLDIDLEVEEKESDVDDGTKEITQILIESKNEKLDIDMKVEQKENVVDNEPKEITQTVVESKNEKLDIDLKVEQKESDVDDGTKEITQILIESKNEKLDVDMKVEQKENVVDNEPKEITQTLVESKNEKLDIDLKVEQKESVVEDQCAEKTMCKQENTGDDKIEESQQTNVVELKVDDSKVEDNPANDLIEPEEDAPADDSLPKSSDDSGFLDNAESDSLNKTSTTETNDSAIMSDCNTVEDLDISLNKSGAENKIDDISPEPAQSDIVNISKDDCKEAVDICDNVSAAVSVTQKKEDVEKVNEILENSIKDNDAKVVEIDHPSSEESKVINMQEENANTAEKKVDRLISEETKSEESKQE